MILRTILVDIVPVSTGNRRIVNGRRAEYIGCHRAVAEPCLVEDVKLIDEELALVDGDIAVFQPEMREAHTAAVVRADATS